MDVSEYFKVTHSTLELHPSVQRGGGVGQRLRWLSSCNVCEVAIKSLGQRSREMPAGCNTALLVARLQELQSQIHGNYHYTARQYSIITTIWVCRNVIYVEIWRYSCCQWKDEAGTSWFSFVKYSL